MKISVIDLVKNYGKDETLVRAVKKCSFDIEHGERVAIVGTSGSGKTTLLNMLGGILCPTDGRIEYDNMPLPFGKEGRLAKFRLEKIGRVFQEYRLIPELTAYENIIMPVLLKGKKPDKKYFERISDMLDISLRLDHYPDELSGGQQQRVAIARALINEPAVLLADEPTGNLDESSTKAVTELLHMTADELGLTLAVVTHDSNVAASMDRIIRINDGNVEVC